MSTNPEVKAVRAQAAAEKAQDRADKFRAQAGDDDESAAMEVQALPDVLKDFDVIRDSQQTQRVRIQLANGDLIEFVIVDPAAFKRHVTATQQLAKQQDQLKAQIRKGFAGAAKKAKTFMQAWQQLSATVDRLKGYHDDLDGEVNQYKTDADGIIGALSDAFGPLMDDLNRLDVANTSWLAGSRLVGALGKTSMATGIGQSVFNLASLGMRLYAYTTATGSAFTADEDAIPAIESGNRGSGFLDWLISRRAAASGTTSPDLEVG